jgi:epoxyqueuosine reductase
VAWPERARSVLIVAVSHPPEKPELDWWFGRVDPPGNRVLARIVRGLCEWIPERFGFEATHLPYHVERGGIYLKEAAVLAGLGCIGLNNLLVTPEHGPRIRLRALTLDVALSSPGPTSFDPCLSCAAPCRDVCPQGVFDGSWVRGRTRLPARTGEFSRAMCFTQMELDIASAIPSDALPDMGPVTAELTAEGPVRVIRYCRACETSCPVGL